MAQMDKELEEAVLHPEIPTPMACEQTELDSSIRGAKENLGNMFANLLRQGRKAVADAETGYTRAVDAEEQAKKMAEEAKRKAIADKQAADKAAADAKAAAAQKAADEKAAQTQATAAAAAQGASIPALNATAVPGLPGASGLTDSVPHTAEQAEQLAKMAHAYFKPDPTAKKWEYKFLDPLMSEMSSADKAGTKEVIKQPFGTIISIGSRDPQAKGSPYMIAKMFVQKLEERPDDDSVTGRYAFAAAIMLQVPATCCTMPQASATCLLHHGLRHMRHAPYHMSHACYRC